MLRMQIFPWVLAIHSGAAATAAFQAVLNVVSLTNPMVIGLCNIIPQVASSSMIGGNELAAWRTSRIYIAIGLPPAVVYFAAAFLVPDLVLRIFYGPNSPYLDLTLDLRLFVVAWVATNIVELMHAFFYGIERGKAAFLVNTGGLFLLALLGIPLAKAYGVIGCAAAFLIVNALRLFASVYIFNEMIMKKSPV